MTLQFAVKYGSLVLVCSNMRTTEYTSYSSDSLLPLCV